MRVGSIVLMRVDIESLGAHNAYGVGAVPTPATTMVL